MLDLITNARALVNLPNAGAGDDATINTLIAAASQAVQRFCRRDFTAASYDELYDGPAGGRLLLRNFPILSVQSVRSRLVTVLQVANLDTGLNQLARVAVTATGLLLQRVSSGIVTNDSVAFAGNATLAALATAVNALGNGWSAQVVGGYGPWPAADLRSPQGAAPAAGRYAELKLHTAELAGYQIDERRGWLLRTSPDTDPDPMQSASQVWPAGRGSIRVQYTAGFSLVPDDVQEACAELVATWFQQRGRDLSLAAENVAGTYSYSAANLDLLPPRVVALLKPYRAHPIAE
jgi:hypothetical protein